MHRHPPTLVATMSPFPHFIDVAASLATARERMELHGFNHLPVKDGGKLVGVVSGGEVDAAEAAGVQLDDVTVASICTRRLLMIDVHAAIVEVARAFADGTADAALVTKDGHLAGIVTTTDLCRVLAELLEPDVPDDVA